MTVHIGFRTDPETKKRIEDRVRNNTKYANVTHFMQIAIEELLEKEGKEVVPAE